jgi:hypothetical protein
LAPEQVEGQAQELEEEQAQELEEEQAQELEQFCLPKEQGGQCADFWWYGPNTPQTICSFPLTLGSDRNRNPFDGNRYRCIQGPNRFLVDNISILTGSRYRCLFKRIIGEVR